jgi:hypothetical protein
MGSQPGLLPRRYQPISTATAAEEEFARFLLAADIICERLSGVETHALIAG